MIQVRVATEHDFAAYGQLLVESYSQLPGFPGPEQQPQYYQMLSQVGQFTRQPGVQIFVAETESGQVCGGVLYFADMAHYGSGGTAASYRRASGIRLLAVDAACRGRGIGEQLTRRCIDEANSRGHQVMLLHTTAAMQSAWRLYQRLGFERFSDIDFTQVSMPVFGFRLHLAQEQQ
ncbi:GNAT family N-acetyltransferase [Rheinheimera sp.]|uniref:GNAT family N-acetyltransferase n=1 Tax=Rheinheimera sp. TaxID=1869214 RepID=UPI00307E78EC